MSKTPGILLVRYETLCRCNRISCYWFILLIRVYVKCQFNFIVCNRQLQICNSTVWALHSHMESTLAYFPILKQLVEAREIFKS